MSDDVIADRVQMRVTHKVHDDQGPVLLSAIDGDGAVVSIRTLPRRSEVTAAVQPGEYIEVTIRRMKAPSI